MRRVLYVLVLLILLRLISSPAPVPAKEVAEAVDSAARGLLTSLEAFGKLDLILHVWLAQSLNGPWLAVYGFLKLVLYALAAVSLWAWRVLSDIRRSIQR